MKYFHKYLRSR